MLKSEYDNLIKWNGKERPFVEAYYLKLNDPAMRIAVWLRYLLFSPSAGEPEGSVWAIFFDANNPSHNLVLKEGISMKDVVFHRKAFDLDIGGALLKNDSASGRIIKDSESIEWNLRWSPAFKGLKIYPAPLYHLPWPSTKFVAPNLKVLASGWVGVNGRQYTFHSAPMHQGHLWGGSLSKGWAWADCGAFFEDKTAVMELVSGGGLGFGYLATAGGERRFMVRGGYNLTDWEFTGRRPFTKIVGRIAAVPQNIIGLTYHDPSGGERYCYNTKVADSEVMVYTRTRRGWALVASLSSNKTTAFETVYPIPSRDIPLWL